MKRKHHLGNDVAYQRQRLQGLTFRNRFHPSRFMRVPTFSLQLDSPSCIRDKQTDKSGRDFKFSLQESETIPIVKRDCGDDGCNVHFAEQQYVLFIMVNPWLGSISGCRFPVAKCFVL